MRITNYKLIALAALLLFSSFAAGQSQWTTVKEWDSGNSANRLDIVIMGDGYTAAEMPIFRTHATNFINAFLAEQPMAAYKNHINIWRIEVESPESGADKPMACFSTPVTVNTELDASYCTGGTQRCLYCNTTKAHGTAMINVPTYDEVVVVVNDSTYGGCGGSVACYSGGNGASLDVAIHELGHSAFGLADEYETAGATYTGGQFGQPNVSNQDAAQMTAAMSKWHYWIGTEGVSAFEGARYNEFGAWRPKPNCMMRSLGQVLCPICREDIIEDLWDYVTDFDSVSPNPNAGPYSYSTTLSVEFPTVSHASLMPEWLIDGTVVSTGNVQSNGATTTYSFVPVTGVPGTGPHTVTFRLTDATNWYRKAQPFRPLPTRSWTVVGEIVDLEVTAFSVDTTPVFGGELFEVSDTVTNLGPDTSSSVRIGYYASSDSNITTADTLIGVRTLPALAAGASATATKLVRMPTEFAGLTPQYHIGIVVDDLGAISEPSEANNIMAHGSTVPFDASTSLSLSTGLIGVTPAQSVTLNLDAGPSYADSSYFLVPSGIGGGGSSSWLGPYHGFVNIVFDDLSSLVIGGMLGAPYFQNFSGVLDANGQAQAVFFKPELPPSFPGGSLHFICGFVEIDGTGTLTCPRVSNLATLFMF